MNPSQLSPSRASEPSRSFWTRLRQRRIGLVIAAAASAASIAVISGCQAAREVYPRPLAAFGGRIFNSGPLRTSKPEPSLTPTPAPAATPPEAAPQPLPAVPPLPTSTPYNDLNEEYDPAPVPEDLQPTAGEIGRPLAPSWSNRVDEMFAHQAGPNSDPNGIGNAAQQRRLMTQTMPISQPVSTARTPVVLGDPLFDGGMTEETRESYANASPTTFPVDALQPPEMLPVAESFLPLEQPPVITPRAKKAQAPELLPEIRPRRIFTASAGPAVAPPQVWPYPAESATAMAATLPAGPTQPVATYPSQPLEPAMPLDPAQPLETYPGLAGSIAADEDPVTPFTLAAPLPPSAADVANAADVPPQPLMASDVYPVAPPTALLSPPATAPMPALIPPGPLAAPQTAENPNGPTLLR